MKSFILRSHRLLYAFLLLGGIACAFPAQAGYRITTIDFPGAIITQTFGINNQGKIAGGASADGVSTISFVYDAKKATFTVLPNVPGLDTSAVGINEPGVVVGAVTDLATTIQSGFILDKGAFTIFDHPGSQFFTVGRGINNAGLVSGYADTDGGTTVSGFIFDPKRNTFTDFLPSNFTIAHGINNKGDVVGNASLNSGDAYPGSPAGNYGFLRRSDGTITLFRVNGVATRARGITDAGVITGDADGSGFVTTLAPGADFQAVTIPAANLLTVPGALQTIPEGIGNSGNVVGIWLDGDANFHGFLAEPTK